MKNILCTLFCLLFVFCGSGLRENVNPDQKNEAYCKKIIISENGDETIYEFDVTGRLISYLGLSLLEAYHKDEWSGVIGEVKLIFKKGYYLNQEYKTGDGNGWFIERNYLGPYIFSEGIHGYEGGREVTLTVIEYDWSGPVGVINATNKKWTSHIDGTVVDKGVSTIIYTDILSPFKGQVFQALIEQGWTAGPHTNDHLADRELYTVTSSDTDIRSTTKGTITYNYSFTSGQLLSKIIITDRSEQQITFSSGDEQIIPDEKTKVVEFFYECK